MSSMRGRILSCIGFVTVLLPLVLIACGGGGSPSNPTTTAPSALSYSTPQALTVNKGITPITPTVTGSVTSYSISPTLPAGITLNTSTGVITGTPTAITAQATYTVTATNSGGSATASLVMSVNDVAPAAKYASGRVALAVGLQTTTLTPASTGGAVTTWTISPALPAGLTFSTTDGTITGTPTATAAAQVYTVTATNSGGSTPISLNLSVENGTLLDVGHNAGIQSMRFDGTHVLSVDVKGHWVLWDYATAANLANGDSDCPQSIACGSAAIIDLAGANFVVHTSAAFEFRAATDGHLLGTIPVGLASNTFTWWKLAADGSYLVVGGPQGLKAWSPAGQTLFAIQGDYTGAVAFAAAGQVRLTGGPTSAHAIETVVASNGTSTVSANYNGLFQGWFSDGERFFTYASGTALVYSKAVVQADAIVLPSLGSLGGMGNWLWNTDSGTLAIYKIGASGAPTASFPVSLPYFVSGTTLGLAGTNQLSVVDLSGTTPTKTDYPLTVGNFASITPGGYAATNATNWLVGNAFGVLLDGAQMPATPRYLNYGSVMSVAGSSSRLAVSTASGRILYFDSNTLALQDRINKFSAEVHLSADGNTLAAVGDAQGAGIPSNHDLVIYSLPSKNVVHTWPHPSTPGGGNVSPFDLIALSSDGTVLAQAGADGFGHEVTSPDGTTVIWTDNGVPGPVCLAPTAGNPLAASNGFPSSMGLPGGIDIINNGSLATAIDGYPVGWLDATHLLVGTYESGHLNTSFAGAVIFSNTGTKVADSPLPEIKTLQLLGPDSIYARELNEIVSPTTGAVSWMSGDASSQLGAVAGSHVVFVSGARVLALSQ